MKYSSAPLSVPSDKEQVTIPLTTPEAGWQAAYIEATFKHDFVATIQVYITPDEKYPKTAPQRKRILSQRLSVDFYHNDT